MKRAFVLFICVIVAALMFGCNLVNNNASNSKNTSSNKINYEIYEKEHAANDNDGRPFKVKYAQIRGLDKKSLENKINTTLMLSMTEWINGTCSWAEDFDLEVKYKASKYLSVSYTLILHDPHNPGTVARIGMTIDMMSGDRVYLNNLVKDTTNLKQLLVSHDYNNEFSAPIDSREAERILHDTSISEKVYFDEIYRTDYPRVYSYLISYLRTKSSFYIEEHDLVVIRDMRPYNDVRIDMSQVGITNIS